MQVTFTCLNIFQSAGTGQIQAAISLPRLGLLEEDLNAITEANHENSR